MNCIKQNACISSVLEEEEENILGLEETQGACYVARKGGPYHHSRAQHVYGAKIVAAQSQKTHTRPSLVSSGWSSWLASLAPLSWVVEVWDSQDCL